MEETNWFLYVTGSITSFHFRNPVTLINGLLSPNSYDDISAPVTFVFVRVMIFTFMLPPVVFMTNVL